MFYVYQVFINKLLLHKTTRMFMTIWKAEVDNFHGWVKTIKHILTYFIPTKSLLLYKIAGIAMAI